MRDRVKYGVISQMLRAPHFIRLISSFKSGSMTKQKDSGRYTFFWSCTGLCSHQRSLVIVLWLDGPVPACPRHISGPFRATSKPQKRKFLRISRLQRSLQAFASLQSTGNFLPLSQKRDWSLLGSRFLFILIA